jgi:predicted nucleic-acid-binding Zn-ribbon protein
MHRNADNFVLPTELVRSKIDAMAIITKPLAPKALALVESALAELRRRGAINDNCPRCRTSDWNVDMVSIPANPLPIPAPRALPGLSGLPGYLPSLIIICKNCGYTMLHNLNVLDINAGQV